MFGRANDMLEGGLAFLEAWLERADGWVERHRRWWWWPLALVPGVIVGLLTGHSAEAIASNMLFIALIFAVGGTIRRLGTRRQRRAN